MNALSRIVNHTTRPSLVFLQWRNPQTLNKKYPPPCPKKDSYLKKGVKLKVFDSCVSPNKRSHQRLSFDCAFTTRLSYFAALANIKSPNFPLNDHACFSHHPARVFWIFGRTSFLMGNAARLTKFSRSSLLANSANDKIHPVLARQ